MRRRPTAPSIEDLIISLPMTLRRRPPTRHRLTARRCCCAHSLAAFCSSSTSRRTGHPACPLQWSSWTLELRRYASPTPSTCASTTYCTTRATTRCISLACATRRTDPNPRRLRTRANGGGSRREQHFRSSVHLRSCAWTLPSSVTDASTSLRIRFVCTVTRSKT